MPMPNSTPGGSPARLAPALLSALRIVTAFMFVSHGAMKLFAFPAAAMPGGGTAALSTLPGVAGVIELVGGGVRAFLAALPADRAAYRYAPDKWTVQQVAAHLIDTERVLAYRALCVARGEAVDLPAFDEDAYMEAMGPDPATLAALGEEFALVRRANLLLFRRLDAAAWGRRGKARGFVLTPRGMAYVLVGHVRHHLAVLTA